MNDLLQSLQLALGDAFRIEAELPGGGMSRVFLAIESSLNRQVVVKVLPPELTSEVSAARFKQEMEFAARLQHPHILPVLAAGAREGILYFVMPFASGESLRRRMEREGRLPPAETIRLVGEIADALAFAHSHGIIHRDIKPENVLLEGRHAVLADFGIARALLESRTGERLTVTGTAVGTPGYMSPEQLAGETVDARADVYALAVVAYEMLSGARPFTGPSPQAVLAAHLTQPPRPLHEVSNDVPPALSAVISRALAKDVSDRYPSAAAFAEALQALTSAATVSSEVAREARQSWYRRPRILAALLALIDTGVVAVRLTMDRAQSRALLARLAAAADSGRLDEIASSLNAASVGLAGTQFASLIPKVGGFLSVRSSPANAAVTITRATPVDDFSNRTPLTLGQTPVESRAVVAGEYFLRVAAPGYDTLDLVSSVAAQDTSVIEARLLPLDSTSRMVYVTGSAGEVPDYLIGRHEVTNREYQRFVDAGGYRSVEHWPETMVVDGRALPRREALSRLVDATGLPGPREWRAGRFPDGKENHPVTGVTWYEATAYARWAGGALPTASQWWRAALGDAAEPFPWGRDGSTIETRANFGLAGTAEVGTHPLGAGPFGAQDLAGNVGEWLAEEGPTKSQRTVVGGSWRDPAYMFERRHAKLVDPGIASDIIGFRIMKAVR